MGVESYQDQLSIDTPEHVALRLPVAGVGSRFLAVFMDTLIQIVAYLLFIGLVVLLVSSVPNAEQAAEPSQRFMAWTIAILIFLHFLAFWGYYTLFEGLWRGQTPGKRIFKLRVIKDSGRQITMVEAMARNLLRVVDALPSMYLVGIIAVLCNRERKRLGDMVAGTLVVHDEELGDLGGMSDASRTFTSGIFAADSTQAQSEPHAALFPATAIARLSEDDLVMLDTYFARIPDLDVITKNAIAQRLLKTLCAKMQVPEPGDATPRVALDAITWELRNHVGMASRR
jgi:uncharacterized RDD family membrane protein YckC